MAIVFFDMDGTLTRCDTFIPYCFIALAHRPWRIFVLKNIFKGYLGFLKDKINRQELKEVFIASFLGQATKKDVAQWNKIFFRFVLPLIKRRKIFEMLQNHQDIGDRVCIVSASLDIYLKPLVDMWQLYGVISTTAEWKKGCISGKISGKNCRGVEKAKRIKRRFSEKELEGSIAYGDSDSDDQMLQIVSFGWKVSVKFGHIVF